MYTYTYNVGDFEQGGFYVNNGQEYNSETEIRSGWLNCGKRIFSFTVETDYTWSFICRDSSGNFIYISAAYEYKASGTTINLSAYPNVSDIRIELHDTNGINPPATCTLVIEFAWTMGANGKPTNEYISDLPDDPLTQPYPKTMWRIVDGKPTHEYLTGISDLPENPLTKPYPKTMWRIDPLVNDGKPYHEYLPIPKPTGAFRNAEKLENVYIPESVKFIGAEAFRFTALKTVKIAADCEYSETSFPEGCEIEFYGGGGTYGQLYDCDGYAVLDCEAARIYVKE